jgi:nucleoside-diphosphate-sugar epimerase
LTATGGRRGTFYVDDLCRAILLALESAVLSPAQCAVLSPAQCAVPSPAQCAVLSPAQCDIGGEVFQIATGVETSIMELADMVRGVVDRDVNVQHGPPRQGDVRKNYSAIAKVRETLGWEPRVELGDGLCETYVWWLGS